MLDKHRSEIRLWWATERKVSAASYALPSGKQWQIMGYHAELGIVVKNDAGEVLTVQPGSKLRRNTNSLLAVGTPEGIELVKNHEAPTFVSKLETHDLAFLEEEGELRLLALTSGVAHEFTLGSKSFAPEETARWGSQDVLRNHDVIGLGSVPLGEGEVAGAALTDRGLSFIRHQHVENRLLPFVDRQTAAIAIDARAGRAVVISNNSVFIFDNRGVRHDLEHPVAAMLSDHELDLTYLARGSSLDVLVHDDPDDESLSLHWVEATLLAKMPNGDIIANNGMKVVRISRGTDQVQDLFEVPQKEPGRRVCRDHISSLLASSDGAVWATSGPSLYRWYEGAVEVYDFLYDPSRFPTRASMLSKVLETHDGRIWVVASDERERAIGDPSMAGGILEWDGFGFRRTGFANSEAPWFITGYTPISENQAVVGTNAGFVNHGLETYLTFEELGNRSYEALAAGMPQLWLGTEGARLGKNLWLFGTSGGIVALQGDTWVYPDRLNKMLPNQHQAEYGSRAVHAISTDASGRIYVGTDAGLTIIDTDGDDLSFLFTGHQNAQSLSTTQ